MAAYTMIQRFLGTQMLPKTASIDDVFATFYRNPLFVIYRVAPVSWLDDLNCQLETVYGKLDTSEAAKSRQLAKCVSRFLFYELTDNLIIWNKIVFLWIDEFWTVSILNRYCCIIFVAQLLSFQSTYSLYCRLIIESTKLRLAADRTQSLQDWNHLLTTLDASLRSSSDAIGSVIK